MKLATVAALALGAAALALGGTVRFLAHPRTAPWVEVAVTRAEQVQAERTRVARELDSFLLREVGREDGARLFVWGHYRVAWGEEIRFASEPAGGILLNATRVRDGWIFHAEHGLLYRSASFAGALRSMALPTGWCADRWFQPSHGRAVVSAPGALFASDGGAFTRLGRTLALRAAAFGSTSWGIGLAHGGRIYETRDGGATWEPAPSIPERASALEGFEGGVRYFTGVWNVLRAGGGASASTPTTAPTLEDHRSIAEAFVRDRTLALPPERPVVCTGDRLHPRATHGLLAAGIAVASGRTRAQPLFAEGVVSRDVLATAQAIVSARRARRGGQVREILHWRMRGGAIREADFAADWMHPDDLPRSNLAVRAVTRNGLFLAGGLGVLRFEAQNAVAQSFEIPRHVHDDLAGLSERRYEPAQFAVTAVDDGIVGWGVALPQDRSYREAPPAPQHSRYAVVPLPRYLVPSPRHLLRRALWRCRVDGCTREDWFADPFHDTVVGAVRHGLRWGVLALEQVIREGAQQPHVEVVASPGFEEAAAELDRALRTGRTLAACAGESGPWEVHTLQNPREPSFGEIGFAGRAPRGSVLDLPGHAVLALGPEGICLLRYEGVVQGYPSATLWLEARDGALVGGMDDGTTITELRGTLTAPPRAP